MSASEQPQVVVVGSCMIDLISYTSRMPKPGETIHGRNFSQGFGGKGANQCVMAARLGARTAMVAKASVSNNHHFTDPAAICQLLYHVNEVGDDTFGHSTIQNFKDSRINYEHVQVSKESSSGVAAITVDDQGENAIVIVSGANLDLRPSDVQQAESLIAMATAVVCQLEVAPEVSLAALKLGKKHGATTILNVAPGVPSLDPDFYHCTDILCLNETEAMMLTGVLVSASDLEGARGVVHRLQALGAGCVVLTLGESGVLFTAVGEKEGVVHHCPAEKVDVVDTTGAGDAFVGALAYYLACHASLSFEEMVRRSGVIASLSVTSKGTQLSYCIDKIPKVLLTS